MHEGQENEIQEDQRPFAEPLEDDARGKKGRLFTLPSHPEVVIRRDKVDLSSPEAVDVAVEKLRNTRELFSTLADRDGMYVARAEYALGEGPDGGESYALVEEITGKTLSEMDSFDALATREVDQCFAHYLAHVCRTLREGGKYWSDMHLAQVVYGTRDGEADPLHMWLTSIHVPING